MVVTMLCLGCGQENVAGARFCHECGTGLGVPAEDHLAPSGSQPMQGQSSASASPPPGAFVGRQREMADLKVVLDDALSGQGRLVMLGGEPGIGKTRTAQELAEYGKTKGAQVHWGWCFQEEGAPPYWPWILPLRSYIQLLSRVNTSLVYD